MLTPPFTPQRHYYVIKPTLHNKRKVTYGDVLTLTDKQAQPLLNGGFIGTHQASAQRIGELVAENQRLAKEIEALKTKKMDHKTATKITTDNTKEKTQ